MDAGERPVVVCSAISGVSDAIEDILRGWLPGIPRMHHGPGPSIRRSPTPWSRSTEHRLDLQEINDRSGASLIRESHPDSTPD